jgi:hypothetical protein
LSIIIDKEADHVTWHLKHPPTNSSSEDTRTHRSTARKDRQDHLQ